MFQIGDEVVFLHLDTLTLEDGIVISIGPSNDTYPIIVKLKKEEESFTADGRYYNTDRIPQLYYKGTTVEIKKAPEPDRKLSDKEEDHI